MSKRVAVLGADGMLGDALMRALILRRVNCDGFNHNALDITERSDVEILDLGGYTCVVNCAGQPNGWGEVNSYGVQTLRENYSGRLIHISTDCVFSSSGVHSDVSIPDPVDLYGASKRLGELFALASGPTVVVRTSFVGPKHGLFPWFMQLPSDTSARGWVRAYWSGGTVDGVAEKLCELIADERRIGVVHISTKDRITKYMLLRYWNELFRVVREVVADYDHEVHRALVPTPGYELAPITLRTRDFMVYKEQIRGS